MSKEKQCECCHEWWYDSDVKENLCPNCYDYFKQLKQQLVEKDKEINSLIVDYEKRISHEQELMSNIEHRLTEKQNTIDEINKEFVQAVHDWKTLCAEKDKEIEKLKQELEETNAGYDFTYEQSSEAIKELKQNQTQLAIQELEKVKMMTEWKFNSIVDVVKYIEQRIKQLKGEWVCGLH